MRGGTSSKNVWNLFFFFVESWTLNILSYHIGSCSVHIYIVYATTSGHGKAVWLSCLNVIIPYLILYSYWEIQYPKYINQSLKCRSIYIQDDAPWLFPPSLCVYAATKSSSQWWPIFFSAAHTCLLMSNMLVLTIMTRWLQWNISHEASCQQLMPFHQTLQQTALLTLLIHKERKHKCIQ